MDAEYLPLARAATLLYGRLFPGDKVKDAKTLDLLAVAITARVPLYQQEVENGPLRKIDEAYIARGRFTRGAARLEVPERAPLRFLLVPRAALYAALDAIAADPILKKCRPQSHPRTPAYSSARGA
jgi:hypothetical protein